MTTPTTAQFRLCRFCGKRIHAPRAYAIRRDTPNRAGAEWCTGRQRMQVNPFAAEIEGNSTPELLCDGQAYEAARDI